MLVEEACIRFVALQVADQLQLCQAAGQGLRQHTVQEKAHTPRITEGHGSNLTVVMRSKIVPAGRHAVPEQSARLSCFASPSQPVLQAGNSCQ